MNSPLLFVPVHSFPLTFEQEGVGSFASFPVLFLGTEEVNTINPAAIISMTMPVSILFLVFMSAGL
jgi:hypothetical protein